MWQEEQRYLNWLLLCIILAVALGVFGILRYLLRPIGTAEIAGEFVAESVGAEVGRPVAFMSPNEKCCFSLVVAKEENEWAGDSSGSSPSMRTRQSSRTYSNDWH